MRTRSRRRNGGSSCAVPVRVEIIRHRRDVVPAAASARWRGGSRKSLLDFHTALTCSAHIRPAATRLRRTIRACRPGQRFGACRRGGCCPTAPGACSPRPVRKSTSESGVDMERPISPISRVLGRPVYYIWSSFTCRDTRVPGHARAPIKIKSCSKAPRPLIYALPAT